MFSAERESSSDDDAKESASPSVSVGDVWLAELSYRSAVARQNTAWSEQGAELEKFFADAKTGEQQRRLKLRHYLQENVLQKHANAYERIQQVHTESLESYFAQTGDNADGAKEHVTQPDLALPRSGDLETTEEKKKSKPKKKKKNLSLLSPKQRIEKIAKKTGTTPVWDDDDEPAAETTKESSQAVPVQIQSVAGTKKDKADEVVGIDLDVRVPVDDEEFKESDLPLLKDAKMKENTVKSDAKDPKSAKSLSKTRSSSFAGAVSKSKTTKSKSKKKSSRKNTKSGVVLDQASSMNAAFLDRILYSGSLLESHYIQMAVVAAAEDDDLFFLR